MTDGMLMPPIPRGVIDRRRRMTSRQTGGRPGHTSRYGRRPVLPLARIGSFVSSPCSRSAARTWASIRAWSGCKHRRTSAHLVGQCRNAEINPFAPISLALPVQRLMLAELLEQDHRLKVRAGKAARRHMEGRRRLCDLLTVPARELLSDRLDDLPLSWNHPPASR